jgi:hypothetical protein
MARLAPIITEAELKEKLSKYLYASEEDGMEEFPWSLSEKVMNDIKKVEFDFENYCIGNAHPSFEKYPTDHSGFASYISGFKTLASGIPVLLVNAGGDWEFPVCFALYWDGKQVRGYFPTKGNVFDAKARMAWGNDDDADLDDNDLNNKIDNDAILADINSRIQIRN